MITHHSNTNYTASSAPTDNNSQPSIYAQHPSLKRRLYPTSPLPVHTPLAGRRYCPAPIPTGAYSIRLNGKDQNQHHFSTTLVFLEQSCHDVYISRLIVIVGSILYFT